MQNQSKDVFLSDTKKNPKDCMVVTLRSGRELENIKEDEKMKTKKENKEEIEKEIKLGSSENTEESRKKKVQQEQLVEERNLKKKEEVQAYMPSIPFLQRLQKAKMEEQFSKFLDMFKKIEINIPFAEALAQIPHYAKFMKDILSKKRRFADEGVRSLTATYSAVIQKNFPLNMQDPDNFTIPCTIGNYGFGKDYVIQGQAST